jgi:carboxyl-terminal processing protease
MDRRSPTRGRIVSPGVLLLAVFTAGMLVDRVVYRTWLYQGPSRDVERTFAPFWQAWKLVQEHYVERDAVQPQRMTQGAIHGMLASLGDIGHTSYLTPEELTRLENNLEGRLEGIGARMRVRNRQPVVAQTLVGSPARAAGLRPGDILLAVNGRDLTGLPLERVVELVRGEAGSAVHLRVAREGQAEPLDFHITRSKVKVPDVVWHLLPGVPVAHIGINDFGKQAHAQVQAAVDEARQRGAKGLILDVRGNPGGLKDQAVAVTSEFLTDGTVYIEQDADGNQTVVPVRPGARATDIPLVVLMDEGTASSAEIFAGALHDHGRAKLVGRRTFGTGTVLQPFELSDGSAVLLAVAKWLTPKGRQIWHQGIAPDIDVALPEDAEVVLPDPKAELDAADLAKSTDKQLLKALEVLKERLRAGAAS